MNKFIRKYNIKYSLVKEKNIYKEIKTLKLKKGLTFFENKLIINYK